MAWYKCFSQGGKPTPSEWAWELYDYDLSSSSTEDDITFGNTPPSYILLNVDTNASAYDNNNSLGILSSREEEFILPEPDGKRGVIQLVLNSYCVIVFIRGRICFSDSDLEQQAVGEIVGTSRQITGDFRNKDIIIEIRHGAIKRYDIYIDGINGHHIIINEVGIPIEWEEGHEGDWRYITRYDTSASFQSSLVIGSNYTGGGHWQFDGHINYLKVR